MKYLSNIQKSRILRELSDKEIKIRKELEELFTRPVPLPRPKKSFFKDLHL